MQDKALGHIQNLGGLVLRSRNDSRARNCADGDENEDALCWDELTTCEASLLPLRSGALPVCCHAASGTDR